MCVDIVFCPLSIYMLKPKKSKNIIIFFSMGLWECPEWRGAAHSNTGAPKVPFSAKMTKMPLVNPRFDRRSNEVKALKKQHFFFMVLHQT